MRKRSSEPIPTTGKPEKVLLHMARQEGEWAGLAVRIRGQVRYRFSNLTSLVAWLRELGKADDVDPKG